MSTNPGPAEGANQVMAQEHSAGAVQFTAHNVRLDDGTLTIPESSRTLDESSWFISAREPDRVPAFQAADIGQA